MERCRFWVLLLLCGLWSSVCQALTEMKRVVGSNVTLVPVYSGDPTEINWKVDGNKVVDMDLKPKLYIKYYRNEDRTKINDTDGRLTIRSLTIGDSGQYKAEVLVNNAVQETRINLIVREIVPSSSSPTSAETKIVPSSSSPTSAETSFVASFSFSSSTGPTDIQKTTSTESQTDGAPSGSTTPTAGPGKPASSRYSGLIIFLIFALIVTLALFSVCWWCFCSKGKKKEVSSTIALLRDVRTEETKAGNDVKPEEEKSILDAQGTEETKAGNDVKPEEEKPLLDAAGTEVTRAENDVTPEEEKSSLDAPGTEPKPGNNVTPDEEKTSLGAPGTEAEAGNNVQSEDEMSASDKGTAL